MDEDIYEYLDTQVLKYDLNKEYINELFLELRETLKVFHKKYKLKKKKIVKHIYKYFINKLNINEKVINISKLKQPEQRTAEWYNMRYNMITASDAASVIGTKTNDINSEELKKIHKHSPFKSKDELIRTKVEMNDVFKGNVYTQHGQIFEPIATTLYEKRNNTNIIEFGLIQHPNISIIGASPDGITKEAIMIEIKAPYKRVINGIVPLNYWIQMQFQLEVCNLETCHFVEIKSKFYNNKEEYINDSNNEDLKTKENLEKGMIIKCSNNTDNIYFYPNINEYNSEKLLNDWIEDRKIYYSEHYENVEILYWKIEKYSCTEIKRDKNWFDKKLGLFKDFWNKIEYYKKYPDKFNLIKKSKSIDIQQDICMIIDSDEEDEENIINKLNNNDKNIKKPKEKKKETENKINTKKLNENENNIKEIKICDIENDLEY